MARGGGPNGEGRRSERCGERVGQHREGAKWLGEAGWHQEGVGR